MLFKKLMKLFGKKESVVEEKEEDYFLVGYTRWVGDPMDSLHPIYDNYMRIPKKLIEGKEYSDVEETVYNYIRSNVYCVALTVEELYLNDYIQEIFIIPEVLLEGDCCPVSKAVEKLVESIKLK